MVTIVEALEDQLRRSMEGVAWHGPSVREALAGIDASDAAKHPIQDAHSCWELVLHLSGSYQLVLRRLDGNAAPLLQQEDWPPVPEPTAKNWQRDVTALYALNARLREAVLRFPIERLYEPIVSDPPYPAFMQFVGLTQHDLYHAGQIVLLKRAQRNRGSSEAIRPHSVGLAHVFESMKDANLQSQATLAAFDVLLEVTASSHSRELQERVKQYDDPHAALADLEREAAALVAQIGELEREMELAHEQAVIRGQQAMEAIQRMHEEMQRRTFAPLEQNEERFGEIEAELSECARLEKDYRDVILQVRSQLTGESDAAVS